VSAIVRIDSFELVESVELVDEVSAFSCGVDVGRFRESHAERRFAEVCV
jgi:hypothetical protein